MPSYFLVVFLVWIGSLNAAPMPLDVNISAESGILMNADNGRVLFEKNAHTAHYPASITKIATALYVLKTNGRNLQAVVAAEQDSIGTVTEDAKIKSNYSLPAYWGEHGGTHIGIKKGEQLRVIDLLYGMMLSSGNDASNVLAQHVGGTIPRFIEDLQTYLKTLGCHDTNFLNPHGLHHPQHVTTAHDMAVITKEALKDPVFCQIVSSKRYTRPKTNMQEASAILQSNMLLKPGKYYYPYAIGVKTGITSKAGNTFVGAARKNGRTLVAVVMGCKKREDVFKDTKLLFETAFSEKEVVKTMLPSGAQNFQIQAEGSSKPVTPIMDEPAILKYFPSEEPEVSCILNCSKLKVPISKGEKIGALVFQDENGFQLVQADLFAGEDVSGGMSSAFFDSARNGNKVFTLRNIFITAGIIAILLYIFRKRR